MTVFDHLYAVETAASARRLEQVAMDVRLRAARLAAATEHCPWDGQGAWAFRASAAGSHARMLRAATRLDASADALRRHGAVVAAAIVAHEAEQARHAEQLLHLVGR